MKARKVAAQFAAYTWYQESRAGREQPGEALRFARENWTAFLSVADEGWGRLLLDIGSARTSRRRKGRRRKLRSKAS